MSSTEITEGPQAQFMRTFCEEFRKGDMAHVAKYLHKDHRRITHPRSVGKPEQTKEEYLQHTAEVMNLWVDIVPTIHSIIEAPGGKVVVHLTSCSATSIGVDMTREMILIAHIVTDEDGSLKIKELEEFTDSKAYLDFFDSIAAAKANKQHVSPFVA